MQVQMTFRQVDPTIEIEELLFREARKLQRVCPQQLTWCHVVIEQPHRHRHEGRPYRAHVAIQGLMGYRVASSESGADVSHETPNIAIINAFQAVRKQLRSKTRVRESVHDRRHWPYGQEA